MKLNRQRNSLASAAFVAALAISPTFAAAQAEFFDIGAYQSATVNRTIVSFDDVVSGTVIDANAYPGLSIAARRVVAIDPQDFAPGLAVGGVNVHSQSNGISASLFYAGPMLVFDNLDDHFTFTLATPARAAGLWIGNVGNSNDDPVTPTTVTFYAADGVAIASEVFRQGHAGQLGTGANNRFFYGIVSEQPIAYFSVVNASLDWDGIIIDDVQWATPVPEPVSAALMLLGLGWLAIGRMRA